MKTEREFQAVDGFSSIQIEFATRISETFESYPENARITAIAGLLKEMGLGEDGLDNGPG